MSQKKPPTMHVVFLVKQMHVFQNDGLEKRIKAKNLHGLEHNFFLNQFVKVSRCVLHVNTTTPESYPQ